MLGFSPAFVTYRSQLAENLMAANERRDVTQQARSHVVRLLVQFKAMAASWKSNQIKSHFLIIIKWSHHLKWTCDF